MSKIEEMAIQFANEMYGEYNTSNIVENGWPKAKSFYEQGAKAVLETIEKECKRIAQPCMNHVENPVDEEDKVDSWARLDEMEYMLKFIEQLKEE